MYLYNYLCTVNCTFVLFRSVNAMVEQLIVGLRKREAFLLERCARIHNEKRESLKEQQQKIRYTVLASVVHNSSTANVSFTYYLDKFILGKP